MGKTKNEKNRKVTSYFGSTKVRTKNQKETKPSIVTALKSVHESSKENKPVRRAPRNRSDTARRRRALVERVRAKGQKTLEETLQGMDLVKKKQKTMLSRAREIANSLSFIYISRNKTVMFVNEIATRIVESSVVPISEYEAIEYFELLTKIAPKWCQFSTNKNKNDLLTINTSMENWRDIVEEGVKGFR
ncbi:hypothetical protein C1645_814026 [Glomus cerebriforme]|uniref:DNA replication factor Cdt1 C-terminal domain-containing protein n=1 Tax=Glomus cerebriforme TaxID=658196 RepID=A0A397TQY0_9GLOM|nr:hypothetical protein C1645_814026 [Glomus cerebriforme]